MTAPLAISSSVTSYASRTPYLTAAEYVQSPTAVDVSNVVQGGSIAKNNNQVTTLIDRASSMADRFVFGAQGCLAATRDIDGPKRCFVGRGGVISFGPRYRPVLEVDAVLVGRTPSTMVAMAAAQAANLVILESGVVEIPAYQLTPYALNGGGGYGGIGYGTHPLVTMTYVNGYPNTTLLAAVTAGGSAVTPFSPIGIYPGSALTIYDTDNGNETVIVASTYVVGATVVPLLNPLALDHAAGIAVSAIPGTVKQAVILILSALIKTRGTAAIVRGKLTSSPTKKTAVDDGAQQDLDAAGDLLQPFVRVSL